MHTFIGIETEVTYRRNAYEREQAAEGRAAQARPHLLGRSWTRLRRIVSSGLQTLAALRLPTALPRTSLARSEEKPWTRIPSVS